MWWFKLSGIDFSRIRTVYSFSINDHFAEKQNLKHIKNFTICSDFPFKVERFYVCFLRGINQSKYNASTLFNSNFSSSLLPDFYFLIYFPMTLFHLFSFHFKS